MKKAWNAIKKKRFNKRTKNLEKQALQYIQKNEKLERQIVEVQENASGFSKQQERPKTAEAVPILANPKSHSETKKSKKYANDKTGHDQEEKIVYNVRPDRLGQEDMKPSITMSKDTKTKVCYKCGLKGHIAHNCKTGKMNTRQRNKIAKRCNFCRKRGHIKKNCPIKQTCWNWMEGRSV